MSSDMMRSSSAVVFLPGPAWREGDPPTDDQRERGRFCKVREKISSLAIC